MKSLLFIIFAIIQFSVSAGEISKVFGKGVFDTAWGDTIKDIKEIYPNGKTEKYGEIIQFVIKDGRPVLGLKRDKKAEIRFAFDSEDRLTGVAVYFDGDDFSTLISKLNTLFGEYTKPNAGGYVVLQWPKDDEVTLTLTVIPSTFSMDTIFSIGYSGLTKPNKSKEQLGF
jgi:hypothetical protein